MLYSVRDGVRTLKFNGQKLAASSSREFNKPRWVEFELYKTPKGQYVLARVGISIYFHNSKCSIVTRNRLSPIDGIDLPQHYIACPSCKPSRVDQDGVFPETPRYWAQVSDNAQGIFEALIKYDDKGTSYLTHVAGDLLEEAAKYDQKIYDAYYVNFIE